jgi:hypothetical protein
MVLLQRFCQSVKLRRRLQRQVKLSQRNADYAPADLFLALIFAVIVGLRRINKTQLLQYNGAFLDLLGLERFPDQTTLRRFLQRLGPQTIRQLVSLHDWLRTQFFSRPKPPAGLIFDLDSVVLTLYGHQQGAHVGYNPKKKGRRSYHPALCFEAYRQEFWHGSLRPGDTSANSGVVFFLQRCLAKVPPGMPRARIRVRADSGFFAGKLIALLERLNLGYVVVAKNYGPIKKRAREAKFSMLKNGFGVAEFHYQPHGWPKARRFVVMRRPIPDDPVEAKQLTLFKDRRYAYSVMVTNLKLAPWRIWRFYQPRATIEKNIRELLYDMPFGKDSFWRLGGQRGFLSYRAFRLRSGALVQTPVSPCAVQSSNRRNGPQRFPDPARQIGKPGRTQRAATAERLLSSKGLRNSISQGRRGATFWKNLNLSVSIRFIRRHFLVFLQIADNIRAFLRFQQFFFDAVGSRTLLK